MLRLFLLLLTSSLILLCAEASAQTKADAQNDRPGDPSQTRKPDASDLGSPAEEILQRAQIKHEEEEHKELVVRAGEMAQIGDEILNSFEHSKSLSRDDLKKLDRMEKLARKIRSNAGASDAAEAEEEVKDSPSQVAAVVKRLAEVSDSLNKNVQKTSRLVISAAVIKNSNELIGLIRRIKSLPHP